MQVLLYFCAATLYWWDISVWNGQNSCNIEMTCRLKTNMSASIVNYKYSMTYQANVNRGAGRSIIGGGGQYSYIQVLHN